MSDEISTFVFETISLFSVSRKVLYSGTSLWPGFHTRWSEFSNLHHFSFEVFKNDDFVLKNSR